MSFEVLPFGNPTHLTVLRPNERLYYEQGTLEVNWS